MLKIRIAKISKVTLLLFRTVWISNEKFEDGQTKFPPTAVSFGNKQTQRSLVLSHQEPPRIRFLLERWRLPFRGRFSVPRPPLPFPKYYYVPHSLPEAVIDPPRSLFVHDCPNITNRPRMVVTTSNNHLACRKNLYRCGLNGGSLAKFWLFPHKSRLLKDQKNKNLGKEELK